MVIGSDAEILAAVGTFIAGRPAGDILDTLYNRAHSIADSPLDELACLLPIEQIAAVQLVGRLNLSDLPSAVILLATLRKIRTNEGWIHFNLCKCLNALVGVGVLEAKLPAIVHSLLAVEGLKDDLPGARTLPLGVLARELANFAPREAIRCGLLATRHGDPTGLTLAASTFIALGLEAITGRPTIAQALQLAKSLHLSADNIPETTSLGNAAGLRSTMIEPARRITFPPVRGDGSHYNFANAGDEVHLPAIAVHILEDGIFSINATAPGLEQHYVFDRNRYCVQEFANGTDPFIAETVLECNEPVAILDDQFAGVMNICHFLLDRLTRIPIYDRAWSRPGKFLQVDDFPYYRDIFARIGFTDRIIIPSSKRISVHAPEILFSSNIAADFRHPAHYCAGWAIDYLRSVLGIEERQARPERKLLISRADARGRAILNWEEVLPVFRRHGFEVAELSGLSTEEQIALFRDASQVVGVHGAGLTNILFAPRNCAVLEILSPLVATRAYWLLASSLGQRYSALLPMMPSCRGPTILSGNTMPPITRATSYCL
jgi:Glycosyltransferase 61